ncbi:MAG: L-threonylcarbamoyladenylate synthase [Bacteroidales bacterium]
MYKEINTTVEYLKTGKIILYPTDTVWGIGCDATDARAVDRIYALKQRVESKSMIILVDSVEMLSKYVKEVPEVAFELIEQISNPLTIIYPNACRLAKNVIANDGSIAIRLVKHEFCSQLIHEFGKPIVSTSANISGMPTPSFFEQISSNITENVDYVVPLFHQKAEQVKPSTIIKLEEGGNYTIIRK